EPPERGAPGEHDGADLVGDRLERVSRLDDGRTRRHRRGLGLGDRLVRAFQGFGHCLPRSKVKGQRSKVRSKVTGEKSGFRCKVSVKGPSPRDGSTSQSKVQVQVKRPTATL